MNNKSSTWTTCQCFLFYLRARFLTWFTADSVFLSGKYTKHLKNKHQSEDIIFSNFLIHFVSLSISHICITITSAPVPWWYWRMSLFLSLKKRHRCSNRQITGSDSSLSPKQLLLSSDRLEMGSARARKTPDWVIPWLKEGGYRFRDLSTQQWLIERKKEAVR